MLKLFSRLEKTRSLIIVLFAVLLVIGLVVAGVYTRTGVAITNPLKSKEVIASVNGDDITVADLMLWKKMREQQFSRYGGQISLAQFGFTDDRLLDELIRQRVMVQEAERLGLVPSSEEVRDVIRQGFKDASGNFDLKLYKDSVTRQFGSVAQYENQVRNELAVQKLRAFVTAGAQVSDQEVQQEYERRNTEFNLTYVPVSAEDVEKKINPTDEELQKYFDEHKTDYRILEPQKKIRYLFINQEKIGEKLTISDEELRKEYDQLKPENKSAGVRVQQIVMKVARPELDAEVLNRATALVARVRGERPDQTASEEAFAEAARGNSEDPATAKQGGWLPNPVRKNPNKADLLQNTLDWREGFVGDPLKTGNAYYIFRRGPTVPKTFEVAKQELVVSMRNRRSYSAAAALAQRATERLKATNNYDEIAKELSAEANMNPADMIKVTPFIKPADDVPEIGSNPTFEEAIKPLEQPNQIGDRVAIKGGFAVPQLLEKRDPPVDPPLADVKAKVTDDYKRERAKGQVEQTARDLASGTAKPEDLKAAAEKLGLKAETEEKYKIGSPLGTAGSDPALDNAIYALKAGELTKTPVKVDERWIVVGATSRKDADLAEFGKERTRLVEMALDTRRSEVFDEYVESLRKNFEQKGGIEINKDVLAKLAESVEPVSAFPRQPGPPINIPRQE
jgi:peptidyl-prolyl cis-trans isomerase D